VFERGGTRVYGGALGGLFNLTALLGLPFYLGLVLALNLRARPTLLGFGGRGGGGGERVL
jgi:hypothetical protein